MSDKELKEIYLYDGINQKKITGFNDEFLKSKVLNKAKHYKSSAFIVINSYF
jgi:hypothetical protein